MKNTLLALVLLLSFDVCAQQGLYNPQNEVRGNGKPVQLTKPTKPFKEIDIRSFPAQITIDAGATEAGVAFTIDENLRPFLRIDDEGGKLILAVLGSVKTMNLTNGANGAVDAQELITQTTNVVSLANGSVRIHAKEMSEVNTGWSSVVNVANSSQKDNK